MSIAGLSHVCLARISALITMYLSIEQYFCMHLPLKIKTIITKRRTFYTFYAMVIINTAILIFYSVGFIRYPVGWGFDTERNRTILDVIPVTDPKGILYEIVSALIVAKIIPLVTSTILDLS